MKFAPFEEILNGLPVWRLQVDDPAAAEAMDMDFMCRQVTLPHGPVFAMALRLHDGQGKPLLFHHALITKSPGFQNVKSYGSALLVFERHGFISSGEKKFELNTGSLSPDFEGTEEALKEYVEAWRRELPRLGSPTAIWAAMEATAAPKAKAQGMPLTAKIAVAIALALAAAIAWFYLRPR